MRRVLITLLGVALIAGGGVALANHLRQEDAVWQTKCQWITANYDDPILYPGQPGASHRHDHFGTKSDAYTTTSKLMNQNPDCTRGASTNFGQEDADHSGYWAPAILYNGKPIDMSRADLDAYYTVGNNHPPIKPFPLGLRIIAGNSKATSPQPARIVQMRCSDNSGGRTSDVTHLPDCRNTGAKDTPIVVVKFPDCWDGKRLDSPDHKSHMAYAGRDGCPGTHPVEVPQLVFTARYLGPWEGGPGSTFASGGVYSAHADFWNGWEPARQQELITKCLNAVRNCRYSPP